MPLAPGTRLGPYEVSALIGAGGMGEVYRARDTNLGRQVAIKVLPDAFARDAERLARFEREAKTLAALNHPNIAAIHGLEKSAGYSALVMELVEGEDLSQRIARGAVPLDEALPIAKQIADALEAAHEQGIIHRDLKPANIKVREDGTVKVLDFGLAKALDPVGIRAGDRANSPTITSPGMTEMGMILGTAAYMSPEQARGKPVDKRADIWAFGCVLYEMLTGRRPFQGEGVTDTLAAVVRGEPDISLVPPQVRRLVDTCLQKDPKKRLRDIGDAWKFLDDAVTPSGSPAKTRSWLPWTVAAVAVVGLTAFVLVTNLRQPAAPGQVSRLTIRNPAGTTLTNDLAVAPDGRRFVFGARGTDGVLALWLQSLDSVTPQQIRHSTGGNRPFWSPDGNSLGFFAGSKLLRLDLPAGTPTPIADAAEQGGYGASWSRDSVIVFASNSVGPLLRVDASGGATQPVTALDTASGETSHRFPTFLPDGKQFLYVALKGATRTSINLGSIDSPGVGRVLVDAGSAAYYAEGHLIFVRPGTSTLVARPFDPDRLEFTGEPRVISDQIQVAPTGLNWASAAFSSAGGLVVYREPRPRTQPTWFDRAGKRLSVLSDPGNFARVELSRNGTTATVVAIEDGNRDIWIYDVVRGQRLSRVTTDSANDDDGVWSHDDKTIVFDSNRTGVYDLYRRNLDAPPGSETVIYSDPQTKFPMNFSPDGKYLVYFTFGDPKTRADVWVLPDPLTSPGEPIPFKATEFFETMPKFSGDGKWIAYGSTESGRSEVWVAPFPGPGGTQLVSRSGGNMPRWRRDGSELFYLSLSGDLMVVSLRISGTTIETGNPTKLFGRVPTNFLSYDVAADGQRILASVVPEGFEEVPITVVQNWPAALSR